MPPRSEPAILSLSCPIAPPSRRTSAAPQLTPEEREALRAVQQSCAAAATRLENEAQHLGELSQLLTPFVTNSEDNAGRTDNSSRSFVEDVVAVAQTLYRERLPSTIATLRFIATVSVTRGFPSHSTVAQRARAVSRRIVRNLDRGGR